MRPQLQRMALVQALMQQGGIKLNSIQTMYYVSPCCFLCLCIPFTLIEAPQLLHGPAAPVGPLVLLANAGCAFFLNVSVYMLIGNTSALTLNVAGVLLPLSGCGPMPRTKISLELSGCSIGGKPWCLGFLQGVFSGAAV